MRKGFLMISVLLLASVLYTACEPVRFYERYAEIPDHRWEADYMLPFNVQIEDTNARYNMYINIRHSSTYPNRNIWLLIHTLSPSGDSVSKRHEFYLSDRRGRWHGKGVGGIYDISLPVQKNMRLREAGNYRFYIQHKMRRETLEHIHDIGLRFEKRSR
jgi:gliding motility-associated lipoprotein GldH